MRPVPHAAVSRDFVAVRVRQRKLHAGAMRGEHAPGDPAAARTHPPQHARRPAPRARGRTRARPARRARRRPTAPARRGAAPRRAPPPAAGPTMPRLDAARRSQARWQRRARRRSAARRARARPARAPARPRSPPATPRARARARRRPRRVARASPGPVTCSLTTPCAGGSRVEPREQRVPCARALAVARRATSRSGAGRPRATRRPCRPPAAAAAGRTGRRRRSRRAPRPPSTSSCGRLPTPVVAHAGSLASIRRGPPPAVGAPPRPCCASAGRTSFQPRVFRPQSGFTHSRSRPTRSSASSSSRSISSTDGTRGEWMS